MLLYELLASERPFVDLSQAQIIDMVLRGQRPDLSQVRELFASTGLPGVVSLTGARLFYSLNTSSDSQGVTLCRSGSQPYT